MGVTLRRQDCWRWAALALSAEAQTTALRSIAIALSAGFHGLVWSADGRGARSAATERQPPGGGGVEAGRGGAWNARRPENVMGTKQNALVVGGVRGGK
ncbi:hypothetical protein THAOC_20005 [Thalassiosira oceanica]|uniref:Uncharacterized protein n=1 Tax=Thalassiosira oceanica TaxID=159749 RepID=K0S3G3_THAOC|nr:hypothetical protein THAOC_20005 [Thalassiosira oceanica]|eukprot:EJK59735.1 hypothetical protein THAOC_20005 [Thalassiosira oceanica]